jgi:hypothetical protein
MLNVELFQSALAERIGSAALTVDLSDGGMSPSLARSTPEFMDSREFPFRGMYTAPLAVGSRKVGRLVACFGTFGAPGKILPELTAHVARQLVEILRRTSLTVPEAA